MFDMEDRDRILDRLAELARSDDEIAGAVVVGSIAAGTADEWSDIDLALAVADGSDVSSAMDRWSAKLIDEFDAAPIFDLRSGDVTFRVFMGPDWTQIDLSFGSESLLRVHGEKFRVLFGDFARADPSTRDPRDALGRALMWARHARASIERGRWWAAEHAISSLRDETLAMCCESRGIRSGYGRGVDDLPPEVTAGFDDALVGSLERDELERALRAAVALVAREARTIDAPELVALAARLPELA